MERSIVLVEAASMFPAVQTQINHTEKNVLIAILFGQ